MKTIFPVELLLKNNLLHIALLLLAVSLNVGCDSVDPAIAKKRAELVLDAKPDGAIEVLALREQMLGENPTSEKVTVVGIIGGIANPTKNSTPEFPWTPGKAQFYLVDTKIAEEAIAHLGTHKDGKPCPFCNDATLDDTVLVRFLNGDNPLATDARELLNLEGHEKVTIQGTAIIMGKKKKEILLLNAEKIFIEKL